MSNEDNIKWRSAGYTFMDVLNIKEIYSSFKNPREISDFIRVHDKGFILEVPLPSIGVAGEHLSIAEDFLQASFLAENLAKSTGSISCNRKTVDTYFARLDFGIVPRDAKAIARLLWEYAAIFDDQERHPRIARRVYSSLDKYSVVLDSQNEFTFSELVEDYYANLVGGAYQEEYADADLYKIYSEFPERRFQYWKSAFGRSTGSIFYSSTEGWIVPPETDLQSLLKSCAGAPSDVIFHRAELQLIDGNAYVVNQDHISSSIFFTGFMLQSECNQA